MIRVLHFHIFVSEGDGIGSFQESSAGMSFGGKAMFSRVRGNGMLLHPSKNNHFYGSAADPI